MWKQHEWLSKILRHIQVHFRGADIYQKSFALEQMLRLIVLLSQVTKIYDRQLLHLQLLPYNQHHYLTIGAINGLLLLFIRYQSVLAIFFSFQITVWCKRCLLMARQKQGHFHRLPGRGKSGQLHVCVLPSSLRSMCVTALVGSKLGEVFTEVRAFYI